MLCTLRRPSSGAGRDMQRALALAARQIHHIAAGAQPLPHI